MNYYFDFDNTIYETAKLTKLMIGAIGNSISKLINEDEEKIIDEAKQSFNSTVDNIFEHSKKMAEKYEVSDIEVIKAVNEVINNGKDIVFEDARKFLEKIKEKQNKLYLLTYIKKGNEAYQMKKIMGADIIKFFNGFIIVTDYKFNLDLKYEEGIFFDDDPRDINGLLEKNALKVIRIRKENNWRSKIDLNNLKVEEYESFDNICLKDLS